MTASSDTPHQPTRRRGGVIVAGAVAGLAVGLAAVYGMGGTGRNDAACSAAVATAKRMAPFSRGEVAAMVVAKEGHRVPNLSFRDGDGKEHTLAAFKGRVVLFNLWATWCVPCRKEMPALDALQEKLGGPSFQVVAVNIDTRDPEKPRNFMKEAGLARLGYFSDQKARSFQDLKGVGRAVGMPTSVLVDAQGCEIGTIAGPAEWASEDAIKLIKAAVKPAAAGY